MNIAPIDRQVVILSAEKKSKRLLSEARDQRYLVLLGEPGIGKSEALKYEAEAEAGQFITAREVMNGADLKPSQTVFIDALDEYRSDGQVKDKIDKLSNALSQQGIQKWRLSCRAEDWRSLADLNAVKRAAGGQDIVVAQLLPLNEAQIQEILSVRGERDPEGFINEAHRLGASAFLQSPLSLTLLHTVVTANNTWPSTRFDLFEQAVKTLAHEHDPERATDPRTAISEIVEAASQLCFYVLASGAEAIWHSNGLPSNSGKSEYVSPSSLGLDHPLARAVLDTALFKGEGHVFEPFHRTVSEFLAARYLASLVTGGMQAPAFPLGRAEALITSVDNKAPSELRGLYAWFAAHLHKQRDIEGALRLIECDAATVLAYGDAAAFDTAGRKAILHNLDKDDPYFLGSLDETTVLGGLAGDDLTEEFISILDAEINSHLQLTVLQALADGPQIERLQPKLREIALDPNRRFWMRDRAARALIKSASDGDHEGCTLLKALNSSPVTKDQVHLRAQIASMISPDILPTSQIRKILADYNSLPEPEDNEEPLDVGVLDSLSNALKRSPRPELFDEPIFLEVDEFFQLKSEVTRFLQRAVAAVINEDPDVEAAKLLTWIDNSKVHIWSKVGAGTTQAVRGWLAVCQRKRELELFLVIIKKTSFDDAPWMPAYQYNSTVDSLPSAELVLDLLSHAQQENQGKQRRRLFEIAAYTAKRSADWLELKDTVIASLQSEGDFTDFISKLLSNPNQEYEEKAAKREREVARKAETQRVENVAKLAPILPQLRSADPSVSTFLLSAARCYRDAVLKKVPDPCVRLAEVSNEEIADGLVEGFIHFTACTDTGLSAAKLGCKTAGQPDYEQEYVIAAGIHQALLNDREKDIASSPLITAITGLRYKWFSQVDQPSISDWAINRLAQDVEEGAELVFTYWNSALEAGRHYLDYLDLFLESDDREFLFQSLRKLLHMQPSLPDLALKQALAAGMDVFSRDELEELIGLALKSESLSKEQRDIWNSAALMLDPDKASNELSNEECQSALLALNGNLYQAMKDFCPNQDALDFVYIEVLGKEISLKQDDWLKPENKSALVNAAIDRLSTSDVSDVGAKLKALIKDVDPSWGSRIAHAAAEHASKLRDKLYTPPSIEELSKALAGGPPVNPADLKACLLEEIDRYKSTLRTGTEMPWKAYWNTNRYGKPTTPKVENVCRDRFLELLRPPLEKYGVAASLPEARRKNDTRADVLLISHAGKNLPIEVKRHFHDELWTAPVNQLAGYASDEGACGYGVYLVFWFGADERATPARPDGRARPKNAQELEKLLISDLPAEMKDTISVFVLDVSKPKSPSD
ncbi:MULTISPECIES: hypothetical protein [unclassified Pseudovibrio]|uniref:NACHT domain-containing protein n=1 Tax=unclassified Pseudovibrio TaxID=2627060 RepID=UPI0007B2EB17|nr:MULTISPECIES: hypothetical protein [unclassified Pseudovibrio]KZL00517.1 hypothetical protein PsW74_02943 [Pseudovibrio sp. W74]KZL07692.1 hypothetical protein PsAD14_04082 [Pseudovibrio sp. Ad14]